MLFPFILPYNKTRLQVSSLHSIYLEECGNQEGYPLLVLHGGPGSRAGPLYRRLFNPQKFRIILFDQRGCGRSKPLGELQENTTFDLVQDIDKIRVFLGINKWFCIFGSSWGCTLALLYSIKFQDKVENILLHGVFTSTFAENREYIEGTPAKYFFPDYYQQFISIIPVKERGDIYNAFLSRFKNLDERKVIPYLKVWERWESIVGNSSALSSSLSARPIKERIAYAKIFCHYLAHNCFLSDQEILQNVNDVPCTIIHSRLDLNCPFIHAWNLYNIMPNAKLFALDKSSHSCFEDENSNQIREISDQL